MRSSPVSVPPNNGPADAAPTETPTGSEPPPSPARRNRPAPCAPVGYFEWGASSQVVVRCSVSNPGFQLASRVKLLRNSPAPVSNTRASAISATSTAPPAPRPRRFTGGGGPRGGAGPHAPAGQAPPAPHVRGKGRGGRRKAR